MVACALVYRILYNQHDVFGLAASFVDSAEHGASWDGREAEPLLNGEYKIVLQLIGVLQNGKLAKRLTDRAIEYVENLTGHSQAGRAERRLRTRSDMEAVQNLRTAIYTFKLRVEAADDGSQKREKLFEQALNYLYRCVMRQLPPILSTAPDDHPQV